MSDAIAATMPAATPSIAMGWRCQCVENQRAIRRSRGVRTPTYPSPPYTWSSQCRFLKRAHRSPIEIPFVDDDVVLCKFDSIAREGSDLPIRSRAQDAPAMEAAMHRAASTNANAEILHAALLGLVVHVEIAIAGAPPEDRRASSPGLRAALAAAQAAITEIAPTPLFKEAA